MQGRGLSPGEVSVRVRQGPGACPLVVTQLDTRRSRTRFASTFELCRDEEEWFAPDWSSKIRMRMGPSRHTARRRRPADSHVTASVGRPGDPSSIRKTPGLISWEVVRIRSMSASGQTVCSVQLAPFGCVPARFARPTSTLDRSRRRVSWPTVRRPMTVRAGRRQSATMAGAPTD